MQRLTSIILIATILFSPVSTVHAQPRLPATADYCSPYNTQALQAVLIQGFEKNIFLQTAHRLALFMRRVTGPLVAGVSSTLLLLHEPERMSFPNQMRVEWIKELPTRLSYWVYSWKKPGRGKKLTSQIPAAYASYPTVDIGGARFREIILNPYLPLMPIVEAIPMGALQKILDEGKTNVLVYDPEFSRDRLTQEQLYAVGDRDPNIPHLQGFVNLDFGVKDFERFRKAFPKLESIHQFSAGYDNVALRAFEDMGIVVTNAGVPLSQAMSEQIVTLMLNAQYRITSRIKTHVSGLTRFLHVTVAELHLQPDILAELLWGQLMRVVLRLDAMLKKGKSPADFIGCDVHPEQTETHGQLATHSELGVKKTLGLVGMGEAGRLLATYAKGHELHRVLYWVDEKAEQRLSLAEEERLNLVWSGTLVHLLEQSDFVIRSREGSETLPVSPQVIDVSHLYTWWFFKGVFTETLRGKTVGIVGASGKIGSRAAKRLASFGMHVSASIRNPNSAEFKKLQTEVKHEWNSDVTYFPLNEKNPFLASIDYLVVAAKLILKKDVPDHPEEATEEWIDEAALKAMKPTAVIVNVGRGPHVDQNALIRFFNSVQGRFLRIYTDVIRDENNPLAPGRPAFVRLARAWITGHTGSAVLVVREAMVSMAHFENYFQLLAGSKPQNLLTPKAWTKRLEKAA